MQMAMNAWDFKGENHAPHCHQEVGDCEVVILDH